MDRYIAGLTRLTALRHLLWLAFNRDRRCQCRVLIQTGLQLLHGQQDRPFRWQKGCPPFPGFIKLRVFSQEVFLRLEFHCGDSVRCR